MSATKQLNDGGATPKVNKTEENVKSYLQENVNKRLKKENDKLRKKEHHAIKNEKKNEGKNGKDLMGRINSTLIASTGINEDVNEIRASVILIDWIIILIMFPRNEPDLNTYFNGVMNYMTPAVRTRLHVDSIKFTAFTDLMGGVTNPIGPPPGTHGTEHTWNYVYPLGLAKSTHTQTFKKEQDKLKKQIKAALVEVYSDIPDSAITIKDTSTLNIRKKTDRRKRRTHAKITETVVDGLTPLGGGNVEITCRITKSSKRASKLNRYTDIEICWSLIERKGMPPATAKECTDKKVITKAKYILELGEDAVGMRLIIFVRWIYTKHESKSGEFDGSSY